MLSPSITSVLIDLSFHSRNEALLSKFSTCRSRYLLRISAFRTRGGFFLHAATPCRNGVPRNLLHRRRIIRRSSFLGPICTAARLALSSTAFPFEVSAVGLESGGCSCGCRPTGGGRQSGFERRVLGCKGGITPTQANHTTVVIVGIRN